MKNSMRLIKFDRNNNAFEKVYNVTHNDGNKTLEQKLTIVRNSFGHFLIDHDMEGFPKFNDETEALLKYANWLERLDEKLNAQLREVLNNK
ncbi:hypothetical protein vBPmiSPMCJR_091 [Proteus phage vB_PmiS_PM-CJR]|nr:hypothetical protein vBPmiSPMCJR_091 [Proteus phage vB_PmiS_PM-CJR]